MAILPIYTAPDPVLKQKCEPVTVFDDQLKQLMNDMLETMYDAPGIGLAAPQVGVLKRMLVLDVADTEDGETRQPMCIINPEILWQSDETHPYKEGCLSVPEQYYEVVRPAKIKLKHQDIGGNEHVIEADGLLATCIQHEMDHLNGILFIDHLSRIKRDMIIRKVTKMKKLGG